MNQVGPTKFESNLDEPKFKVGDVVGYKGEKHVIHYIGEAEGFVRIRITHCGNSATPWVSAACIKPWEEPKSLADELAEAFANVLTKEVGPRDYMKPKGLDELVALIKQADIKRKEQ